MTPLVLPYLPNIFSPPPFKKSPRDRPFPPRTFHRVFSPPQAEKISDNLGLFLARKTTKEMQAKKFWTCFHLEVRCRPKRFGLGLFFVVPFWIFFGLHTFLRIGEWKKQKSQSRAPQWKIIFYSSSPLGIFFRVVGCPQMKSTCYSASWKLFILLIFVGWGIPPNLVPIQHSKKLRHIFF